MKLPKLGTHLFWFPMDKDGRPVIRPGAHRDVHVHSARDYAVGSVLIVLSTVTEP